MFKTRRRVWSAATCLLFASAKSVADSPSSQVFEISLKSQPLHQALAEIANQTQVSVLYKTDVAPNVIAPAFYCAACPARDAFDAVLKNTGLYLSLSGTYATILSEDDPTIPRSVLPLIQVVPVPTGIQQVLVTGTDARPPSSPDDLSSSITFGRQSLDQRGGSDVNSFLRDRLAAYSEVHVDPESPVQSHLIQQDVAQFGTSRVLTTINGRRQPLIWIGGVPIQPSFTGLPKIALESITLQPGVSAALYGPGAYAAVLEAKLRETAHGLDVQVDYESPTRGDAHQKSVSFIGGFSMWDRTKVILYGMFSERNLLTVGDRYGAQTESGECGDLAVPPLGRGVNIRSATGAPLFGPGSPSCTSIPAGSGEVTIESLERSAGTYDLSRPDTAQAGALHSALMPEFRMFSITGRLQSELPLGVGVTFEAGFGRNAVSAPFSPFGWLSAARVGAKSNVLGQELLVTYPANGLDGTMDTIVRNQHALLVVTKTLPHDWHLALDTSWARVGVEMYGVIAADGSDSTADGSLDLLRDVQSSPLDLSPLRGQRKTSEQPTELTTSSIRFGGPVAIADEKNLVISGLVEYSTERFGGDGAYEASSFTPGQEPAPRSRLLEQRRDTKSAGLELRFPVRLVKKAEFCKNPLEVMMAARIDDADSNVAAVRKPYASTVAEPRYESEQQSISRNLGLCSRISPSWILRASGGESKQLMPLNYLVPALSRDYDEGVFIDGRRGGEPSGKVTFSHGGNPTLRPELLSSWSTGAVFSPSESLRVALDYTRLLIRGPAVAPEIPVAIDLADMEDWSPGSVKRAPKRDDGFDVGPVESVNLAARNGIRRETDLFQLQLDYSTAGAFETRFNVHTSVAYQPNTKIQYTADSDFLNQPLNWRGVNDLSVTRKNFTVGWFSHYSDRYSLGQATVPRWISHDLYGRYVFPQEVYGTQLRVEAGVRNLFGEPVPMNVGSGVSNYSLPGDPRGRTYYFVVRMGIG